jgi:hypothetical protein
MQVFALRNSHKKKSQVAAENAKREAEKEKYKKNSYGMSYEDWDVDVDDRIKKENSCGLDLMDMEMDSFKVEQEEETRRAGKSKYAEVEREYFTPVNAKVNAPADGDYWGKDYGQRYIVKEERNEDGQQDGEKKKGGFANIDSEKWAKIGSQVAFGMLSTGE